MRTFRQEKVERLESIPIYVCDSCNVEIVNPHENSCASQRPLMPMFIGFNDIKRSFGDSVGTYRKIVTGQKYGVDLGEWCKSCREKWFEDLLIMFPHAKKVKIND